MNKVVSLPPPVKIPSRQKHLFEIAFGDESDMEFLQQVVEKFIEIAGFRADLVFKELEGSLQGAERAIEDYEDVLKSMETSEELQELKDRNNALTTLELHRAAL